LQYFETIHVPLLSLVFGFSDMGYELAPSAFVFQVFPTHGSQYATKQD